MSDPAPKTSDLTGKLPARPSHAPRRPAPLDLRTRDRRVLELQRRAGNQAVGSLLGQGGQSLPEPLRAEMESRFAIDLRDVRIHNDARAQKLAAQEQAKAFTYGSHIAFGEGRFSAKSTEGRRLLGHEVAHVIQQRRGGAPAGTDESERDAQRAGDAFLGAGGSVAVRGATTVGIARAGDDEISVRRLLRRIPQAWRAEEGDRARRDKNAEPPLESFAPGRQRTGTGSRS